PGHRSPAGGAAEGQRSQSAQPGPRIALPGHPQGLPARRPGLGRVPAQPQEPAGSGRQSVPEGQQLGLASRIEQVMASGAAFLRLGESVSYWVARPESSTGVAWVLAQTTTPFATGSGRPTQVDFLFLIHRLGEVVGSRRNASAPALGRPGPI